MDNPTDEARVSALEANDRRQDERIESHGKELDKLTLAVAEIQTSDHHRDESMQRMESKLDAQSGKLDALRQDVIVKTTGRSAALWEKAVWAVIAAVILYALSRIGIK